MKTYLTHQMKEELIDILELHQGYFGTKVDHIIGVLNNELTTIDPYKKAEEIIKSVSNITGVSVEEIKSPKRDRNVTISRQYAMHQVYEQLYTLGLSLSQIGKIFNRDHSTVLYSVRTIVNAIEVKDPLITIIHEKYKQ